MSRVVPTVITGVSSPQVHNHELDTKPLVKLRPWPPAKKGFVGAHKKSKKEPRVVDSDTEETASSSGLDDDEEDDGEDEEETDSDQDSDGMDEDNTPRPPPTKARKSVANAPKAAAAAAGVDEIVGRVIEEVLCGHRSLRELAVGTRLRGDRKFAHETVTTIAYLQGFNLTLRAIDRRAAGKLRLRYECSHRTRKSCRWSLVLRAPSEAGPFVVERLESSHSNHEVTPRSQSGLLERRKPLPASPASVSDDEADVDDALDDEALDDGAIVEESGSDGDEDAEATRGSPKASLLSAAVRDPLRTEAEDAAELEYVQVRRFSLLVALRKTHPTGAEGVCEASNATSLRPRLRVSWILGRALR